MRVLRVVGVLLVAMAAATLVFPRQLGVSMLTGYAQLISFKVPIAFALAALALLFGWSWVGSGGSGRRSLFRPVVATVLLAAALTQMGIVWHRGVPSTARPTLAQLQAAVPAKGELTVVSLNTEWDKVPAGRVAVLAQAASAQVIALPESEKSHAQDVAKELATLGLGQWQVFASSSPWPNAMLVSPTLGRYSQVDPGVNGLVMAKPASGTGPTLITVHASPPARLWPLVSWTTQEQQMEQWRTSTTAIANRIQQEKYVVAAGDFNSTADHASFIRSGDYQWAGKGSGFGTWPTFIPALVGAPIDHVISDTAHWTISNLWVVDVQSTDHRAVVARLSPR